jgi:hypothetical protein
MATMRVVQVSRPNGPFEIVERQIPDPAGQYGSRYRLAASATAIPWSKRELSRELSTHGSQAMRWPGCRVTPHHFTNVNISRRGAGLVASRAGGADREFDRAGICRRALTSQDTTRIGHTRPTPRSNSTV